MKVTRPDIRGAREDVIATGLVETEATAKRGRRWSQKAEWHASMK